jgi:hypothetical protein
MFARLFNGPVKFYAPASLPVWVSFDGKSWRDAALTHGYEIRERQIHSMATVAGSAWMFVNASINGREMVFGAPVGKFIRA